MLHGRLLLLDRSRLGRLRQARRSFALCAMLRYLLLLANPAQLFPVNPGKGEHTSRSAIVLAWPLRVPAEDLFRAGRLRHPLVTTAWRVRACRLPVLRCRRNCFDLTESENDASRAIGIIRLNDRQMKSAFAPAPPTCPANAWPHTQLLASDDEGQFHQGEAKTNINSRRQSFCFDPAAESCG